MEKELIILRAMRFYTDVEAPSESDVELLFRAIYDHDMETIEDLLGAKGV